MNAVGQPQKQLGAEAYFYVMINAPMTYLTLIRLQKSDGWSYLKQEIKTNKKIKTHVLILSTKSYISSSSVITATTTAHIQI